MHSAWRIEQRGFKNRRRSPGSGKQRVSDVGGQKPPDVGGQRSAVGKGRRTKDRGQRTEDRNGKKTSDIINRSAPPEAGAELPCRDLLLPCFISSRFLIRFLPLQPTLTTPSTRFGIPLGIFSAMGIGVFPAYFSTPDPCPEKEQKHRESALPSPFSSPAGSPGTGLGADRSGGDAVSLSLSRRDRADRRRRPDPSLCISLPSRADHRPPAVLSPDVQPDPADSIGMRTLHEKRAGPFLQSLIVQPHRQPPSKNNAALGPALSRVA